MTNEQKTKELVQTWCNNKYFARDVYNAIMDMAEWKDAQFEKVIQMLCLQLSAYSKEISSKTVMTII